MQHRVIIFAIIALLCSACGSISPKARIKAPQVVKAEVPQVVKGRSQKAIKQSEVIEFKKSSTEILSEAEKTAYYNLLMQYRLGNYAEFKKTTNRFVESYPHSIYADNAVYYLGLLALENRDYSSALAQFEKVISHYPNGDKVVSAIYAKAITYKRINLIGMSRKAFKQIEKLYPGSPESFQAQSEMRLFETN